MALAFRQLSIDISANVSILFVGTVVVNNILFFFFLKQCQVSVSNDLVLVSSLETKSTNIRQIKPAPLAFGRTLI